MFKIDFELENLSRVFCLTLEGTGETTWNVLKAEVFLSAFPPSNMKEHQRNILCVFLVQAYSFELVTVAHQSYSL